MHAANRLESTGARKRACAPRRERPAVKKAAPPSVIRRLPQYLAYLSERPGKGRAFVSSQEIARALNLTSSTVRQDITHLDITGQNKRGYACGDLKQVLMRTLRVGGEQRLVIVGAGNFGKALALHGNLGRYGYRVRAIVDGDPGVVGQAIGHFKVQSIDRLADVVRTERITIGIITVPAPSAQNVADRLIMAGVRGILNLTFSRVVAPRRVQVVDSRIVSSLMLLSCLLGAESAPRRRKIARP